MKKTAELNLPGKENWGSRLGVVLAVAGSAVGLGNFLRFPGTAVNNGGGAFMIPYIISFIVLGVPIAWCEWTIGRLGGRYGQNNAPGIMFALWRRAPAKMIGTMTVLIPVLVYIYYVLLEALCLRYAVEFFTGGFAETFQQAAAAAGSGDVSSAITGASADFTVKSFGMEKNGAMFGSEMLWYVLICFVCNFIIIYRGITRGIETFCKIAMPLLVLCAVAILIRVLTLDNVVEGRTIGSGLGFMWNPDWAKLWEPEVWLRAAGQIFFSLSVGFGLILCYSSYLRSDDDVVLSSLSASSTNEFCEVVLGGLIIVPTAFLFLGPGNTPPGTFALGFITVPAIMHFMPGGSFFGGMWFGLLFLAAVTSSISMLQPATAFLEDGFGMKRRASVTVLSVFTLAGASLVMYYSENVTALDFTDFWCEFMMIVAALGQVIIFGWVIGAERGFAEARRGADLKIPSFMPFVVRYITPTYLIVVLGMWCYFNGPDRLRQMSPSLQGDLAVRSVYEAAIAAHFSDADEMAIASHVNQILGEGNSIPESLESLPAWLRVVDQDANDARAPAERTATVARFVFVAIVILFLLMLGLADMACRGRIGNVIKQAEDAGVEMEAAP